MKNIGSSKNCTTLALLNPANKGRFGDPFDERETAVDEFSQYLQHENGRKCFLAEQCSIEECLGSFLSPENLRLFRKLAKIVHAVHPVGRFRVYMHKGKRTGYRDKEGELCYIIGRDQKPLLPWQALDFQIKPGQIVKERLQKIEEDITVYYYYEPLSMYGRAPSMAEVIMQTPNSFLRDLYAFEVLWTDDGFPVGIGKATIQLYKCEKAA